MFMSPFEPPVFTDLGPSSLPNLAIYAREHPSVKKLCKDSLTCFRNELHSRFARAPDPEAEANPSTFHVLNVERTVDILASLHY
jgi:hypothetical protein